MLLLLRYLTTGRSPQTYRSIRGGPYSAPTSPACARGSWMHSVSLLAGGCFRPTLVFQFEQRFLGIVKLKKIHHLTCSRSACAASLIGHELASDPFITQNLQPRLMQKRWRV